MLSIAAIAIVNLDKRPFELSYTFLETTAMQQIYVLAIKVCMCFADGVVSRNVWNKNVMNGYLIFVEKEMLRCAWMRSARKWDLLVEFSNKK